MRATVSVPPPGSKPTTMVIGLLGKFWAAAPCARAMAASAAKRGVLRNLLILAGLEERFSLFHEGTAAFGVILAREALLHPRGAGGGIVIAFADLPDDAFRGADGERGVGGDHVAVGARSCLELGYGHHLVHEPLLE